MSIIQTATAWIRKTMLAVAGNVSLFFVTAFIIPHVMIGFPFEGMLELTNMLELYFVFPWGASLSLLTLMRREENKLEKPRADICVMFLMLLWIAVPFTIRFGLTRGNLSAVHGHIVLFFGLYTTIVMHSRQQREKLLDLAAALFAVFSYPFAGTLLTAAWGNTIIPYQYGSFPFGMYVQGSLCAGIHYNGTALIAGFGAFMCLIGFVRRKNIVLRIAHLIPAVMMILVVILTQSRTTRYAMIAAFAVTLYGYIASGCWHKQALIRHAAGILAGIVMLVGGYIGAAKITDAALYRYAVVDAQRNLQKQGNSADSTEDAATVVAKLIVAEAKADEEETPAQGEPLIVQPKNARGMGEATFTGRTRIWKGAIDLWKANPFHFFIGQGHGRSDEELGRYSGLGAISAHNAYIQLILDYGLIGFVLMMTLLGLAVPHAWRVFFAKPACAVSGGRLLCAMIVMGLVSGLMESEIFHILRYSNLAFFYALAMIVAFGRDMVE